MTWFDGGVITLELKTAHACHKKKCLQEEACGPPSWSSKPTWNAGSPWVQCWPSSPNLTGGQLQRCSLRHQLARRTSSKALIAMDSWISVMPTFLINSFIVVRVFESKQKTVLVRDTSYFKPLPGPLADRIILPPGSHISRPSSSSASSSQQPWKQLTCMDLPSFLPPHFSGGSGK